MSDFLVWREPVWNHLFDDAFFGKPVRTEAAKFVPACDVEETDSHYVVSLDLPGVAKQDLKLETRDNKLFVSGERKLESKSGARIGRAYGKFERVFELPNNVNVTGIEATHENGVLTVSIPKAEEAKARVIPIGEAKTV